MPRRTALIEEMLEALTTITPAEADILCQMWHDIVGEPTASAMTELIEAAADAGLTTEVIRATAAAAAAANLAAQGQLWFAQGEIGSTDLQTLHQAARAAVAAETARDVMNESGYITLTTPWWTAMGGRW